MVTEEKEPTPKLNPLMAKRTKNDNLTQIKKIQEKGI